MRAFGIYARTSGHHLQVWREGLSQHEMHERAVGMDVRKSGNDLQVWRAGLRIAEFMRAVGMDGCAHVWASLAGLSPYLRIADFMHA